LDFYNIRTRETKNGLQAYPDWIVDNFEDLMIRGGSFYAVWDEEAGLWSTNEFDIRRFVDADLLAYAEEKGREGSLVEPALVRNFGTGTWERFNKYLRSIGDSFHSLDDKITFANETVKRNDYVSKKLPYSCKEGRTDAWDELVGVLYSPEERDKIEWCIGAIVSGDSRWIQKFLVFYGAPATGKSTIIGVIEKLFEGYVVAFEARALTSGNSAFAAEAFASNPLVAIQHDGDLSKVEDNTRLNSIVGHDTMTINVKFRSAFSMRPSAFVILGTNTPVRITNAKAGNTRRMIDVSPTGVKIDPARYHVLVSSIDFELGAIAYKCQQRFREMGKYYYENYLPTRMMAMTDPFYNYVEAHYDIFKTGDAIQLKQAWQLYKQYCEESNIIKRLQYHEVRHELQNYFTDFKDRHFIGDREVRSVYIGFKGLPTKGPPPFVPDTSYTIELESYDPARFDSAFNRIYSEQMAQEATSSGYPHSKWEKVTTTLSEIDVTKLHYVKVPENHIVIDFDLKDETGEKSLELNIEKASIFPPTYTEVSQSGKGLHLHYIYEGDIDIADLNAKYDEGIEVKTLLGDSSLRRKLTRCNNIDVMPLSDGLPRKEKVVLKTKNIQTEKSLRALIERNLKKDIHPGTKPSVDFIHHILQEAYDEGLSYDLTDMRGRILSFAASSSNHSADCIKVVNSMQFKSQNSMEEKIPGGDSPIIFFDVEVYPNLFVVCWKYENDDKVVRMINPESKDIEPLFGMKLVGFNNRRYDNHILYARFLGYSLDQLFQLSQKLISNDRSRNSGLFGEAYNLSYADIYDFSSKKQGLKKFQIELGIFHHEVDLPWDEPVPEESWKLVEDYCVNDVISTEAVFKAREHDFVARQILSELSGLSVNHTTQQHTAKIIFGDDKNPQQSFEYTDLSEDFPGYKFDGVESTYGDEIVGEGGYVYAEPGFYEDVTVLDIVSMHPTSIVELNLFGKYTTTFQNLKDARIAIKNGDYEVARILLGEKAEKHLEGAEDNPDVAEGLSYALKIVINIVYGLTSARFDSKFKDNRNKDNIVAKRGALFMIDLKHAVQDEGFQVVHIKTDSIKVPNATPEIIRLICELGEERGYTFSHETTYQKFCLVNDAVYVAKDDRGWTAVGAQFQHPYVFKQLFSHEPLDFNDLCETKNVVKGRIYLDMAGTGEVEDMIHIGRTGSFMPVRYDGGILWRVNEGKKYKVVGTKDYIWVEREVAQHRNQIDELFTDMDYFDTLKQDAVKAIEQFVPFEDFIS